MSDEITQPLQKTTPNLSKQEYEYALQKLKYNEVFEGIKRQLEEMGGSKPLSQEEIDYINDLAKRRTDNYFKELSTPKPPKLPREIPDELLPKGKTQPLSLPESEMNKVRMNIDTSALEKDKISRLLGKSGAALGLGLAAKDLYEKDSGNALVSALEGASALAGPSVSRVAPLLDLLRSTSTATEEQEMSELEKHRFEQLQKILTRQKENQKREPSNEE